MFIFPSLINFFRTINQYSQRREKEKVMMMAMPTRMTMMTTTKRNLYKVTQVKRTTEAATSVGPEWLEGKVADMSNPLQTELGRPRCQGGLYMARKLTECVDQGNCISSSPLTPTPPTICTFKSGKRGGIAVV